MSIISIHSYKRAVLCATVHGQGHEDNKRVMMTDVLLVQKIKACVHVGNVHEPHTIFNDSENNHATEKHTLSKKSMFDIFTFIKKPITNNIRAR